MRVFLDGIGVFAPGLVDWPASAPTLAGTRPYAPGPGPRLAPAVLPADVRRRTSDHIRLGVEVADQAVRMAGADARDLASVFASSESDGVLTHHICEEVAKDVPQVSPTRFHNSVNNAPAGYWCMAAGSRAPSTSVCGWDASFAVGLLEAALQVRIGQRSVLLVAHDSPLPDPLHARRPLVAAVGIALLLRPVTSGRAVAALTVELADAPTETMLADAGLEALRAGNPAARGLPLLAAIARRAAATVTLPHTAGLGLRVRIEPA